jgi:hypothetical protein
MALAEMTARDDPRPAEENAALDALLNAMDTLSNAIDAAPTAGAAYAEAETRAAARELDVDVVLQRVRRDLRTLSTLFDRDDRRVVAAGNPTQQRLALHRAAIREIIERMFDQHANPKREVAGEREDFVQQVVEALQLTGFSNPDRQRRQLRQSG